MYQSDSIRLGRKSIAALVEYLESKYTRTELKHLLFKHNLQSRFFGSNKREALGNVFYLLVGNRSDESEHKNALALLEEITQSLLNESQKEDFFFENKQKSLEDYEKIKHALRADGLDLVEGKVIRFISPSVEQAEEQGILEIYLKNLGWDITLNHFKQAVDNASSGNWEAANSQIRAFMESLCDNIAASIYKNEGQPPTGGEARKYLADIQFLNNDEAELLKALFKLLHTAGSHPGTSNEADCHRRRLMAVALANYFLDRLEYWDQ